MIVDYRDATEYSPTICFEKFVMQKMRPHFLFLLLLDTRSGIISGLEAWWDGDVGEDSLGKEKITASTFSISKLTWLSRLHNDCVSSFFITSTVLMIAYHWHCRKTRSPMIGLHELHEIGLETWKPQQHQTSHQIKPGAFHLVCAILHPTRLLSNTTGLWIDRTQLCKQSWFLILCQHVSNVFCINTCRSPQTCKTYNLVEPINTFHVRIDAIFTL